MGWADDPNGAERVGVDGLAWLLDSLADRVARRVVEQLRASGPERPPELLTIEEAAQRLRVSETTIRRWKRSGTLPTQRVGRRVLVRSADVLAVLARESLGTETGGPGAVESDPEAERAWARLTKRAG